MIEFAALTWPAGLPRAESRRHAPYKVTSFARVLAGVERNVELLGGNAGLVVCSNLPMRADGEPLPGDLKPRDPGVVVYWTELRWSANALRWFIGCDRWKSVLHNLHAIELNLEARRGLKRWGCSELVGEADAGAVAAGGGR